MCSGASADFMSENCRESCEKCELDREDQCTIDGKVTLFIFRTFFEFRLFNFDKMLNFSARPGPIDRKTQGIHQGLFH